MKRLILIAGLLLGGCASIPSDEYDIGARHSQINFLNNMEEQAKQLTINLEEREARNAIEAEQKEWSRQNDAKIDQRIAEDEAKNFSFNLGRGLGITSKCAQARMSNSSYYNHFKTKVLKDAKSNPNYDAAKVQAGFEQGVVIGSQLMHTNPYMMLQGCAQMNAAVESDVSVNHTKVSDFQ